MALSERLTHELNAELIALERLRDGVEERIEAIRTLLKPLDAERPRQVSDPSLSKVKPELKGVGLRESIMRVFESLRVSLRANQVCNELRARGFDGINGTALSPRVSAEMVRLSKRGQLKKVERGVYRLAG